MMKNPKVSVIIPVYNMGKYIRECLDTVVAQSLKNIEIICVDDGSTDNSRSIISEYRQKDKRVILLTQENQGAGPARNNGIRHAKGEFIAFMDPDDYYPEKQTLQKMYDAAIKNKVLICGGCFSELHNGDYGYHRFLYKRKFLKDNNLYFPPLLRFQDPPFFISAMIKAGEFYALNYPTYVYRNCYKKVIYKKKKLYSLLKGLTFDLKISAAYNLTYLHWLTYSRIIKEFSNQIFSLKKMMDLKYLNLLFHCINSVNLDLLKISNIKLLHIFPILNRKQTQKCVTYSFTIIPLIKISSNSQSSKYYLLGFIPLLKIRNK